MNVIDGRKHTVRAIQVVFALALLAVFPLGCTKPAQVTAIEVYGVRNLPHTTARITDPSEIERVVALTRALADERKRIDLGMDVEFARVARLRLIYAERHDDLTLAGGLIRVPDDPDGSFYNPDNQAQAQLWDFVLARLGSSKP